MAGDLKLKYAADAAFTQTNLDGIASSATWVAGWTSETITNTGEYIDYLISGQFQAESASLSATGAIYVWVYAALDDAPTWGDIFSSGTEGTEGTAEWHDANTRDGRARFAAVIFTDNTASQYYSFGPVSVASLYGGTLPKTWAVFVAQSTGTTLETTGDPNKLYYCPILAQYT